MCVHVRACILLCVCFRSSRVLTGTYFPEWSKDTFWKRFFYFFSCNLFFLKALHKPIYVMWLPHRSTWSAALLYCKYWCTFTHYDISLACQLDYYWKTWLTTYNLKSILSTPPPWNLKMSTSCLLLLLFICRNIPPLFSICLSQIFFLIFPDVKLLGCGTFKRKNSCLIIRQTYSPQIAFVFLALAVSQTGYKMKIELDSKKRGISRETSGYIFSVLSLCVCFLESARYGCFPFEESKLFCDHNLR